MKKLLVMTALSTVTLVFAAAPAALADMPMDNSQPTDNSTALTAGSGTDASGQLQPAGTGTGSVPGVAQVDPAVYDQIRADAAPLGNYQPPAKTNGSTWATLIGFIVGLVLGGLAVFVGLRLFRSAPAKS